LESIFDAGRMCKIETMALFKKKAIYKRDSDSFSNIVNLGQLAMEDEEIESTTEILNFVFTKYSLITQIQAYMLFIINQKKQCKTDYDTINTELNDLIKPG
jgi:hypothetical protein